MGDGRGREPRRRDTKLINASFFQNLLSQVAQKVQQYNDKVFQVMLGH